MALVVFDLTSKIIDNKYSNEFSIKLAQMDRLHKISRSE